MLYYRHAKASLLPEMFTCFRKNSHITVQKIELTVIGFPLTQRKQGNRRQGCQACTVYSIAEIHVGINKQVKY